MSGYALTSNGSHAEQIVLYGARYAKGPQESEHGAIQISGGRIRGIISGACHSPATESNRTGVDLSGFLIMPGLINAHDHLEFALFPRLADPPYRNYVDWGTDIHNKFPDAITRLRALPQDHG